MVGVTSGELRVQMGGVGWVVVCLCESEIKCVVKQGKEMGKCGLNRRSVVRTCNAYM